MLSRLSLSPWLSLLVVLPACIQLVAGSSVPTHKPSHGGVVSEVKECSEAGADVMRVGGNAADAIVATTLCVGVIGAYHSGIGGGGFMIVRFNKPHGGHDYEMIDFRETMPAAGNETMYIDSHDPKASTIGGLSVGVPGELRGWQTLHQRHGKLPWAVLVQPAIKKARYGFKVNKDLATRLNTTLYPFLLKDPLWAETYAPHGKIVKEGETIYRKRYANTLEKLALHGPNYFYTGPLAKSIASTAVSRGGILTTKDLANYSVVIRQPNNITYRNTRIFSTVAPSSGSVVLSILKIFEGYNGSATELDPAINVTSHRLIQATKFGYGQRTNYGDPAFTSNVTALEKLYLQDSTAAEVRSLIQDNTTHIVPYYVPSNYSILDDHGTSHVAAMDASGLAISLTTTVNLIWGSQVMTPDGIILNDEMDDFSSPGQTNSFGFPASPINFIRPFKRPQSSISSSIVEDLKTGDLIMATGAAGGSKIITATMENLHYFIDLGLSAGETVRKGRVHDQLGVATEVEEARPDLGISGYSNSTVAFLKSIGYNITYDYIIGNIGHVVAHSKKDGFSVGPDPRGLASGGAVF